MSPFDRKNANKWISELLTSRKERNFYADMFKNSFYALIDEGSEEDVAEEQYALFLGFLYQKGIISNRPYADKEIQELYCYIYNKIKVG